MEPCNQCGQSTHQTPCDDARGAHVNPAAALREELAAERAEVKRLGLKLDAECYLRDEYLGRANAYAEERDEWIDRHAVAIDDMAKLGHERDAAIQDRDQLRGALERRVLAAEKRITELSHDNVRLNAAYTAACQREAAAKVDAEKWMGRYDEAAAFTVDRLTAVTAERDAARADLAQAVAQRDDEIQKCQKHYAEHYTRADAAEREAARLRGLLKCAVDSLIDTRAWMRAETVPLCDADAFESVDNDANAIIDIARAALRDEESTDG